MPYSGAGSGTAQDPYIITDVNQLDEVRNDITAYYELGNDIDASATVNWNGGEGFQPIATNTNGLRFIGSLEGNGFTIDGLFINRPTEDDVALFRAAYPYCEIKNLNIINANITGNERCAILLGHGRDVFVENVHVQGVIKYNNHNSAGMVAHAWNSEFEDCSVSIDMTPQDGITRGWDCGGFVSQAQSGHFVRCKVKGTLYTDGAGGFIGQAQVRNGRDLLISDCYTEVVMNDPGWASGGFVATTAAFAGSTGAIFFNRCYTSGFKGSSGKAFLGYAYLVASFIECYYDSDVIGNSGDSYAVGRTTAQMQSLSNYPTPAWDIVPKSQYVDETWYIDDGVDYPRHGFMLVPPPPVAGSRLKAYDNGQWVSGTLKKWDGSSWVTHNLRYWDGENWVSV